MTREEFADAAADLVSHLQVPISMPGFRDKMGPGAFEAWNHLRGQVTTFGWFKRPQARHAFRQLVADPDIEERLDVARRIEMKAHGGPNPGCDCLSCKAVRLLRGAA